MWHYIRCPVHHISSTQGVPERTSSVILTLSLMCEVPPSGFSAACEYNTFKSVLKSHVDIRFCSSCNLHAMTTLPHFVEDCTRVSTTLCRFILSMPSTHRQFIRELMPKLRVHLDLPLGPSQREPLLRDITRAIIRGLVCSMVLRLSSSHALEYRLSLTALLDQTRLQPLRRLNVWKWQDRWILMSTWALILKT